jgi:uncharacterized membrane protein YcaP (DUF421 family)
MWNSIFHLDITVTEKVLRTVVIYAFLVFALRIAGKRELGQANTLDLVVLLLVANAIQNGIIGADNSVTGALIGASVLFIMNSLVSHGTYEIPWLSGVIEGQPTVLIADGMPEVKALRRNCITLADLNSVARRQGFANLGEVHSAILETNGTVTMFRESEPGHYHPAYPFGLRIGKRRRGPSGA